MGARRQRRHSSPASAAGRRTDSSYMAAIYAVPWRKRKRRRYVPCPAHYCAVVRRTGQTLTRFRKSGIHSQTAATVEVYLGVLFDRLNALLTEKNVNKATTPMFVMATGGMRALQAENPDGYNPLAAAITDVCAAQQFMQSTYTLATGEDEAIFGWLSANYSLGRLENAGSATYGFLEMGGASVQIAYQPSAQALIGYVGPLTNLTFNWNGQARTLQVFTEMIDDLGTRTARTRYFNALAVNHDRCSPGGLQSNPANPAVIGSGLCVPPTTLVQTPHPQNRRQRLVESVVPVYRLLNCPVPACVNRGGWSGAGQPCLLPNAPVIDFAPQNMRFMGGASFWHATRAIYRFNILPGNSFHRADFNRLIIDFAKDPWATHQAEIQAEVAQEVGQMGDAAVIAKVAGVGTIAVKRNTLIARKRETAEKHRATALFCAMLVFTTLYDGIGLPHNTAGLFDDPAVVGDGGFYPFNGVVGLHDGDPTKKVAYSWTLGRALIHATNSPLPVQVRFLLLLFPVSRCILTLAQVPHP